MSGRTLQQYIADAVVQAPPGQPFILASGKLSSYYVDLRRALLEDGNVLELAATALYEKLPGEVTHLGGVPTAGLVLLGPLLMRCQQMDSFLRMPRRGFYTRAQAKGHGLGAQVEGHHGAGIACLVEDTVTSGGSVIQHAEIARSAGLDVRYALAVFDREQGAAARLLEHGITLLACVRSSEVL